MCNTACLFDDICKTNLVPHLSDAGSLGLPQTEGGMSPCGVQPVSSTISVGPVETQICPIPHRRRLSNPCIGLAQSRCPAASWKTSISPIKPRPKPEPACVRRALMSSFPSSRSPVESAWPACISRSVPLLVSLLHTAGSGSSLVRLLVSSPALA